MLDDCHATIYIYMVYVVNVTKSIGSICRFSVYTYAYPSFVDNPLPERSFLLLNLLSLLVVFVGLPFW